jgi:hypothetical protein
MRRSERMPELLLAITALAAAVAAIALLAPAASAQEAGPEVDSARGDLFWSFIVAVDEVNAKLAEIDGALCSASLALSETGIEGEEARGVLQDLAELGPFVIDAITVDIDGVISEVMPEEYQHVQGISISDQAHIERLLTTRRPVGLAYIESVEGVYAMDFASPIFDEVGRFAGGVTVLVNSTVLFGEILAPYQAGGSAKIWAMTPEGTVIYDPDADQIGKNTFDDPLFADLQELLAVGRKVQKERSGTGYYEIFGDTREVFWTTADYQGGEIRVLLSVDRGEV